MSRFASSVSSSLVRIRVPVSRLPLNFCHRRWASSFSSSIPSQAAGPAASVSSVHYSRSSEGDLSFSSSVSSSSDSPTSMISNVLMPDTTPMPLTELNRHGKELAGEDFPMEADTDEVTNYASTPVLDSIDSNLSAHPLSSSEIVFEEMRLSDILRSKERYGSTIHSVGSTDRIVAATELMAHMNIGAVLVRDEKHSNQIAGIVSTRDFVKKIQEKNLHPTNSPVSEFMTPSPVFAYSDETALSCLYLMSKHNFRHLPVRERKVNAKEEEKTVGLISVGDLVRVMLKQFRQSNTYLREFIDGRYTH